MTQPFVFPSMTEAQRVAFFANYRAVEKDEVVGVFLGGFGAHHFYLRRPGTGVLYLLFSWTGITYIIGWIEAFFMPGRVRQFNQEQAAYLASVIVSGNYAMPVLAATATATACSRCGAGSPAGARFCAKCGGQISGESAAGAVTASWKTERG